jgi:hypothetical protein
MNQFSSKEPWEMTEDEWNAERESIRSSSSGEHRKSLYPHSPNGARQWQEHFDWLTMNLPPHWRRYRGDEPYLSTEIPKPDDEDFEDAFQVPINYEMVIAEAKHRGLVNGT